MTVQTAPVLTVTGLTLALPKGADRPFAVEDVSFEVRRGEILCLVGESGSGKTALSHAIMGALPAGLKRSAGEIRLGDRSLTDLSARDLRRLRGDRMAMIPQEPIAALNPSIRVGRQIEEVLELHTGMSPAERRTRCLSLLAAMKIADPERVAGAWPHQLSGGQCQRAVIAMALAVHPDLLIADEPTTALDVTTQAQILNLFGDLRARGDHGILMVTHDFGVVAEIADRVAVMRHGQIVEIGPVDDILNRPAHPYSRQLIDCLPRATPEPRPAPTGDAVLNLQKVCKSYGQHQVLKDVELTLQRGSTLSIVGESGSGKSTLARLLVRLTSCSAGQALMDGEDLFDLRGPALQRMRGRVQMVFQDPYGALNPRRTVGDVIARAARLTGLDARGAKARTLELLALVGLPPEAHDRRPAAFSGGQRQRIGIARALATNPEILIADESVSALDVSIQAQILELLQSLQTRFGLSILFITHDLRVAGQISDTIAVLKDGEVVEYGPAQQVLHSPGHPYTRALIQASPGGLA
ncbi:MAG: ABC transporter ATP-binding protein [Caulobacter sp.]|nr:ABC transporter ATP-binding protein [Caulobacter sp.]